MAKVRDLCSSVDAHSRIVNFLRVSVDRPENILLRNRHLEFHGWGFVSSQERNSSKKVAAIDQDGESTPAVETMCLVEV